jgi:hypothetical protein
VQLLTRTGLDWTDKYPSASAALANLNVKTVYLDGELCGVDDAGLPSFAQTQAATDGERGARVVYYAFDLLRALRAGKPAADGEKPNGSTARSSSSLAGRTPKERGRISGASARLLH